MPDSLAAVVPIIGYFVVGMVLRRSRLANADNGHFLLRLLFFVAIPALIVITLTSAQLRTDRLILPLVCIIVSLSGMAMALGVGTRASMTKARLGPMVLGAMILNNAFLLPFVLAGFGQEGLVDLVMFDVGNSLMVSLVAYPLAFRFGGQDADLWAALRRTVTAPITWSIAIGLGLNATSATLPDSAVDFLAPLAASVGPMILIALGILFEPSFADMGYVGTTVALRMLGGLVVGTAATLIFGITGDTQTIVILGSASPIGFTALTFSSMASLDSESAARAISAALVVGIIAAPLVVALAGG